MAESSPFGIVYLNDKDPMDPIAMGKTIIAKNPFKYMVYPRAPPTSSTNFALVTEEGWANGDNDDLPISYTKENVVNTAKTLFSNEDPQNDDLFEYKFFTNKQLYNKLVTYMPKLAQVFSQQQVSLMLNKEKLYFGNMLLLKVNGKTVRGRYLYGFKEEKETGSDSFRTYIEQTHGEWINVGYIRKSPSEELESTRDRLIKTAVLRVVRAFSRASNTILGRDYEASTIKYNDGTTQDLFNLIPNVKENIRLCIIDYAGLSTNPSDVKTMLKMHKQIVEIVFVHKHGIEVLERQMMLTNPSVLKEFDCRTGAVWR